MRPTDQHTHGGGSRAADRPTDHRGRYVPDGSWPPGPGRAGAAGAGAALRRHGHPESGANSSRRAGVVGGLARTGGLGRGRSPSVTAPAPCCSAPACRRRPSPTTRRPQQGSVGRGQWREQPPLLRGRAWPRTYQLVVHLLTRAALVPSRPASTGCPASLVSHPARRHRSAGTGSTGWKGLPGTASPARPSTTSSSDKSGRSYRTWPVGAA